MKTSIILPALALFHAATAAESCPIAKTQQGELRGVHLNDDVDAFLGVPFAEAPVGSLRFRPAKALAQSKAPIDASKLGAACIQHRYNDLLKADFDTPTESEDCLNLNIYIPRKQNTSESLSTLVWFYGGSMSEGGNNLLIYNPQALVASQGIIVVVPNYRLNLFGFPNTPAISDDAQNLGIRDQRAALEWLRDNLDALGGDPKKITMGGESAGADSAIAHTYWYPEDPIARALFCESGIPVALGQYDDSDFKRIANATGCRNATDRSAELDCMTKVPADTLKLANSNKTINDFGTPFGGNPMIDNHTYFSVEEYAKRGEAGNFSKIPLFIGMNNHEGDGVIRWDPKCGVNQTLSEMMTELFFECPMTQETGYRVKYNVPVWRYRYMATFSKVKLYPWVRSYHSSEIPYVLGSYPTVGVDKPVDPVEAAASSYFQKLVGSFVRDPTEGLSKIGLPTYDPEKKTLIELFNNETASSMLGDPQEYNTQCKDPQPVPVEAFSEPPPTC